MKTIRITGVPEHFNFPWRNVVSAQPFEKEGILLQWTDESKGSGQMNKYLREEQTDIAIVLTESYLKDFENGNPSKMIGFHVKSPLIWGIHIQGDCNSSSVKEITTPQFLISREGSGSQLMSYVLAERENWDANTIKFKEIGNLDGALEAMKASDPEMFLWEKYTTKPWVDNGQMKRIGEVPSPWPCFVMVATQTALKEFGDVIFKLRDLVYKESKKLQEDSETVKKIAVNYNLQEEDVKQWLAQTQWETENKVSQSAMNKAMARMKDLRILKEILALEEFLPHHEVAILD